MSDEFNDNVIENKLVQLRCHFTWKLQFEDNELPDLENRILDQIEFLDNNFNVGIHNLLAYVKHLNGHNKEALESLKEAEDLMRAGHIPHSEAIELVTWGNYAWLYYHMDRLEDAQIYLDKVENTCKKRASPSCYSIECPEMDCKEGWALLKCGGENYERAKACFEKALKVDPENPEFSTGYAIVVYRLDVINKTSYSYNSFCLEPLKRAIRLNPKDVYVKCLLAVKLQKIRQEAEGEKYIEEALANMSSQAYVYRYAAMFYRKKGSIDKALQLLKRALQATPSSALVHHQMGLCYRSQVYKLSKATKWQPRGQDRENIDRITKLAISHLEFAVEQKPTFDIAYLHLAEMYSVAGNTRKAEETYRKVFCMKSTEEEKMQEIYFQQGQFQEFQRKSEVDAIIYYLKAIKIEKPSSVRDRSISSLEKVVLRKLQRNAVDIESLSILGFTYKLKGEMNKALEYYERALRLAANFESPVGHAP